MAEGKPGEAGRRRYDALRTAAQPGSRAAPTALDGAPVAPKAVISRERVPAGFYATVVLRRGDTLRIIDDTGGSSVSLLAWRREDPSERINCADTMKVEWSAAVGRGAVILSDMGRVMLSVIEDTSGAHDLLTGGSTPASTLAAFGAVTRNSRENLIAAASKLGLGIRDIPACLTLFAPVAVDAAGRFVWRDGCKRRGDFVDLRAEMNVMIAASNCAHPLDPARPAASGPVTLITHCTEPPAGGDPRRTGAPEIMRAFAFTDRLMHEEQPR